MENLSIESKPNDGYMCKGIESTNVRSLHNQGFYGEKMRVCVIDTGYNLHDFTKDNILCGKNFVNENNPNDFNDEDGHGTFCIGEIVQVAPKCEIVVAKALDKGGSGSYKTIINAFRYAIEQKCNVISMSLGGTTPSQELHELIKLANELDIIVCTSAGNSGDGDSKTDEIAYPANYEESVNVGAINLDKGIAKYSNSNQWVDICAVGTNIVSTYLNNKWCTTSGTSMSCPIVAGISLLLREKFIKEYDRIPSEKELYSQLMKHTEDLHISRRFQGNGMILIQEF